MYLTLLQLKLNLEHSFLFGAPCPGGSFFGFPKWYKYLNGKRSIVEGQRVCTPELTGLNDVWLIVLAIIEILLRVAVVVAVMFVIVGGIKYITASGQSGGGGSPDKIGTAKKTVIDALIGLIIAVSATAVVSFIAGTFQQ